MATRTREELINYIVTNCGHCDEDDQEVLNELTDELLLGWAGDIENAQSDDDKAIVNTMREALGEELTPELVANALKPKASKALTDDEWMDIAPPQVKSAMQTAMAITANERRGIVERLVANVEDADKKAALTKSLSKKSTDDLREMSELIPKAAKEEAGTLNSYLGSAVPSHETSVENEDPDEILPIPAIDWAAVGRAQRRQA